MLAFDLLIGLATLGRIVNATFEEFRALQGMNRLRHAYLEMVPTVQPYLSASPHDDVASVLSAYGSANGPPSLLGDLLHGITTTPGMIAMINAVIGGALLATLALLTGASGTVALVAGVVGFVAVFAIGTIALVRGFGRADRVLEVRFPAPSAGGTAGYGGGNGADGG